MAGSTDWASLVLVCPQYTLGWGEGFGPMPRAPFLAAGASILLWLFAPALFAAIDIPTGPSPQPAVVVFMDFDSKPEGASIEAMKKEADDLLKSSGIALDWKMLSGNHGTETSPGLVVVKFRGRCRVEAWQQLGKDEAPASTQTLGFTRVTNGHVLPFSEIECDQIRKALNYIAPGSTPMQRQKAFGLAMGRVVAHELYHILARTTSHGEEGLAKASQSLRDLVTAPAIAFQEKDSRAIGQSFTRQ